MTYQNYKCEKDYRNSFLDYYCKHDEYDNYDKCHKCDKHDNCHKCHKWDHCYDEEMTHVHEYSESVKLAEEGDDRHNHRAAGVTGEVIPIYGGKNHVHKIKRDNTDFLDHFHMICVTTGPAIPIPGTDKHVHLVCGQTTVADNHFHEFLFTTQIDAPLV